MTNTDRSSRAEIFSDDAVYRRTPLGQRELVRASDGAGGAALRLLARVNGYTELRRLIDLAPGDASDLMKVLPGLVHAHLIEAVDPLELHAR